MSKRTCRLVLAGVLFLMGCGGAGRPVKVEGVVTLDGKALPGATITFSPAKEGGRIAHGRSESDGSFRLTTFRTDDGALPGDYTVTVVLRDGGDKAEGLNPMAMSNEEKMKYFSKPAQYGPQGKPDKSKSKIPDLYADPKVSPLKEVVPPSGKVEINLSSKAR